MVLPTGTYTYDEKTMVDHQLFEYMYVPLLYLI